MFVTNDKRNPVAVDASGQTITITGNADVSGSTVTIQSSVEPFQESFQLSSSSVIVQQDLVTAPANRRLTLAAVSAFDNSRSLRYLALYERCQGAFKGVLSLHPEDTNDSVSMLHEATTFEVRPGCELRAIARRNASSPQSLVVSLTGAWTDVEAPQ